MDGTILCSLITTYTKSPKAAPPRPARSVRRTIGVGDRVEALGPARDKTPFGMKDVDIRGMGGVVISKTKGQMIIATDPQRVSGILPGFARGDYWVKRDGVRLQ